MVLIIAAKLKIVYFCELIAKAHGLFSARIYDI